MCDKVWITKVTEKKARFNYFVVSITIKIGFPTTVSFFSAID